LIKIENIDVKDGIASKAKLPLVLQTEGQDAGSRFGSFNLRAGESKAVPLVHTANTVSGYIAIHHEAGEWWLHDIRKCILTIAAYGSSSPANASVEVWIDQNEKRIVARPLGGFLSST
jgi:hypothetical protein